MEVAEEIENQIVETRHKIRVFDESINSLKNWGATVGVIESIRVREQLADELAQLTNAIVAVNQL
jgi:hypothetical protein